MQWADMKLFPALDDMRHSFESEGLPIPPVPEVLASEVQTIGNWEWGTRMPEVSTYDLHFYADETRPDTPPYLLVTHEGHGMQSIALHYYLALPGITCLLQEPWGGAYTNNEKAAGRLRRGFELVRKLVDKLQGASPQTRHIVVQSGLWPSRLGTATSGGVVWTESDTPFEDAMAL